MRNNCLSLSFEVRRRAMKMVQRKIRKGCRFSAVHVRIKPGFFDTVRVKRHQER